MVHHDGAAAAEGVPEEVPTPVAGQGHHGGGQGLPQGSVVAHGPVASLVEPRAAGIQEELALILHDGELELVEGSDLRQAFEPVVPAQPICSGLVDNGLAVGDGVELGVQAVALHGEFAVLGNVVLQGQGLDTLVEFLKAPGREAPQPQQDPFAHPQPQIGRGQGLDPAVEEDPAVLHPDVRHVQPAQFVPHQALQAEEARNGKSEIIHRSAPESKK